MLAELAAHLSFAHIIAFFLQFLLQLTHRVLEEQSTRKKCRCRQQPLDVGQVTYNRVCDTRKLDLDSDTLAGKVRL